MGSVEVLRRLDLSATDRAVVLHADDIGMCAATVAAYRDLVGSPAVSAASAMVPCGWFPAIAELCRAGHRKCDMGVHLTLNSEWTGYRWRPITQAARRVLADEAGYLPRSAEEVYGRPDAVQIVAAELTAQLDHAIASGVDVTHLDSHMLTLFSAGLVNVYIGLSRTYRIPSGLPRMAPDELRRLCNVSDQHATATAAAIARADEDGLVSFDTWVALPLDTAADRLDTATRLLDSLPAGLSYFAVHPAVETDELKAIAPDWPARVADYRLCGDDRWINAIDRSGVTVVGMRAVRAAMFGDDASVS